MQLGELIVKYRKDHDMSLRAFSRAAGLSATYVSMLEKGMNGRGSVPTPSIDTYRAVATAMGMSVDELVRTVDDKIDMSQRFVDLQFFVQPARDIDPIYDALNDAGRKDLCRYGKYLTTLDEYRRDEEEPIIDLIPFYTTAAAAGYAAPIDGEDYKMIERPRDCPANADFAIKIDGDSMEPYIKDGQMVYVKRGEHLQEFDVGIFFVAGDVYCKQYCPGYAGWTYLLSANPKREDANISLSPEDGRGLTCFGKVMLKKRLPRPDYF